ncbi:hypothetical protein N300_04309, partial [Calypte anna]
QTSKSRLHCAFMSNFLAFETERQSVSPDETGRSLALL